MARLLRGVGDFTAQVVRLLSPQQPPLEVPDDPGADEWVTAHGWRLFDSERRPTAPETPVSSPLDMRVESEPARGRPEVGTLLGEGHVAAASEVRQEEARHVAMESEVRQQVGREEAKLPADVLAAHFISTDVQHLSRGRDSPAAARAVLDVIAAASPDLAVLPQPPASKKKENR